MGQGQMEKVQKQVAEWGIVKVQILKMMIVQEEDKDAEWVEEEVENKCDTMTRVNN